MLIVQIAGGLGNQLFQYAFGRALALRNSCQLKLDLSSIANDEKREYSLKPFNIDAKIASKSEIEIIYGNNLSFIGRVRRKIFNKKIQIIHEKNLLFNRQYLKIKKPAYLIGYWQSEKYFIEFQNVIRNEFKILRKPTAPNQDLLNIINNCNSVSIHIRRGDYKSDRKTNELHGTCSIEYYENAIQIINTKVSNPIFYIFSDDIPWAKENIKFKIEKYFVNINDSNTAYEDLNLMASCKHNIIANSTFSWWGAWLNSSSSKIVIAPMIWFANENWNKESIDIIPSNWIRI